MTDINRKTYSTFDEMPGYTPKEQLAMDLDELEQRFNQARTDNSPIGTARSIYNQAFALARKNGLTSFWGGKQGTKLANEIVTSGQITNITKETHDHVTGVSIPAPSVKTYELPEQTIMADRDTLEWEGSRGVIPQEAEIPINFKRLLQKPEQKTYTDPGIRIESTLPNGRHLSQPYHAEDRGQTPPPIPEGVVNGEEAVDDIVTEQKQPLPKIEAEWEGSRGVIPQEFNDNKTFSSPSDSSSIFNRQIQDQKIYGKFMDNPAVIARTGAMRLNDSKRFIRDELSNLEDNSSVVVDIGSALGNSSNKTAGITIKEYHDDPVINKKAYVVGTDIPDQYSKWKNLPGRYNIHTEEIPYTFNTPVSDIVKKYGDRKNVIVTAANSIDLLMNKEETYEHFKHLASTLKDKNVTYLFNKHILRKNAGSTKFDLVGELNNAGFDHKTPSWILNKERKPYTMYSSR